MVELRLMHARSTTQFTGSNVEKLSEALFTQVTSPNTLPQHALPTRSPNTLPRTLLQHAPPTRSPTTLPQYTPPIRSTNTLPQHTPPTLSPGGDSDTQGTTAARRLLCLLPRDLCRLALLLFASHPPRRPPRVQLERRGRGAAQVATCAPQPRRAHKTDGCRSDPQGLHKGERS